MPGIQVTVLDETKVRKNDKILHERLQEAKALDRNRKTTSGAVMHKFSLWSNVGKGTSGEEVVGDAQNQVEEPGGRRRTAQHAHQAIPGPG